MKFFHLSDLHIGKQLYHYNRIEEQRYILAQVAELAKQQQPDAVLIAGDIYDTPVPSAEAVGVFDEFLTTLACNLTKSKICIIAGNHDGARRLDFASSILEKQNVLIAGTVPLSPEEKLKKTCIYDEYGETWIYLLPFVKPSYVRALFQEEVPSYHDAVQMLLAREEIDCSKRNILVSHQFYTFSGKEPQICDSEVRLVGGIENVDSVVLESFDYAALGHLHRKQSAGETKNRYCGTLLPYSVSEADDKKSVTMVELKEKGSAPIITEFFIPPLFPVQKLTGRLEQILNAASEEMRQNYVSITLTDEVECYQPKEQLEEVFDHILEIKIDNERTKSLLAFSEKEVEHLEPYEAFLQFFQEMNVRELTPQEDNVIREIINSEKEKML